MSDLGMPPPDRSLPDRIDRFVFRTELCVATCLVAALLCVVALGALARGLGMPLIWTDEAAALLMASATFPAASALIASREHVEIPLLAGMLPPRAARVAAILSDLALLAVLLALSVLVWRWFAPLDLLTPMLGAEPPMFPNFLYSEPTATLGLRRLWFWLALPLFCLGACLHVLTRLIRLAQGAR
ncbi:TRAP transporter small permease [Oceanicola sp. S124]|uniref:TRAP transporter small permease n=1 Tax=Oceanicola sp. S124 TaxID=1042378 RepID=UPI000255901C|nr:TRAP transporter small permease subunit [Oceanicola sp. S124]